MLSRSGVKPRGRSPIVFPTAPIESRRRRLWIEWVATALFSTVLLTTLVVSGVTNRLDNVLYDFGLRLKHTPIRRDIVIVAIDPLSLKKEGQWPWPRQAEAELIADIASDAPRAVACYFLFLFPSSKVDDQAVHDAMLRTRTYLGLAQSASTGGHGPAFLTPIPEIASAARGLGTGDAIADEDGVVRRVILKAHARAGENERLVLQLARLAPLSAGRGRWAFRSGELLIPYAGPPGAFTTIPASVVLGGKVKRGFFRDKIVLMGATAPGLLDNYATPISAEGGMPNVEVDANILNSLLGNGGILPVSPGITLTLSLIPLWILLVALVRLGPRDNLLLAAGLSALPLGGSLAAVLFLNLWMGPAPFLVTLAILLPYWGWRRLNAASAYFAEELRSLERTGGALVARKRGIAGGGDIVLQQITLLEETKKRISDLRRFVEDILANFPDPVMVVDRGGRVLTANQAASDFAGRIGVSIASGHPIEPLMNMVAAHARDARPLWPPPDRSDVFGSLSSARPLTGIGPTGRAYELRFTPTLSGDGEPNGWIVHLADVTPLVSAMRQREDALELLSHDMRTPLAAIMAIIHHPEFEAEPATMRQRIEYQTGRTLDLADAFVRLAKAESAEYALEPIDLCHAVMDATDAVWPLANAAGVTVNFDLDDVEYVVLADRGLLTRALINLLDNAVKFSPAGASVTCTLTPTALNGRAAVACEIADVGSGIAQSQIARLFRKFDSARGALNGSEGIGLGLALVHTVVTRHEGTIACESGEGSGTTFTVTLPVFDESAADKLTMAQAS